MKKIIKKIALLQILYLLPIFSFAQVVVQPAVAKTDCFSKPDNLGDLISTATCTIRVYLIPLMFSLALLIFIYGVVWYIWKGKDSKEQEEGKKFMLWGIIALFVMVSVWGIVSILTNTFGLGTVFIPQLQQ
ncbi:MAG: hypothetical protein WDK96_03110 [Candidatus Paceibacterota bacterium]|jgi:hypothetical protein